MIFFWSQKSACSTLFGALTQTYGENNRFYHRSSKPWKECRQIIEHQGYHSSVIVRNPYGRIISCYINKFVYRRGPLRRVSDLEGFSKALLRTAYETGLSSPPTGSDPNAANTLTFEEFLSTIAHLMGERADENDNSINGHWDTQLPPDALGFEYDYLVHVENFSSEFSHLCEATGLSYNGAAKNKTEYDESSQGYLGRFPATELADAPISQRNFRSPTTDQMIQHLYAIDFEGFGYRH